MGSAFVFKAVSESPELAEASIAKAIAEVVRIEALISSWKENSETFLINKSAGKKPVKVSEELFKLIERCLKVSSLTDGFFDISYASVDKIWDFQQTYSSLPDSALVKASVEKINFQNIVLNKVEGTVFLKEKGMKIGFGAIGKGYAANRAKAIMQNDGIGAGVVNAGGDLISWGLNANQKEWSVGIIDPLDKSKIILWLDASNRAVVTSGDYERFVMFDGTRFAHIIDPKTGWPAKGMKSVTIICPDAELADALATSVFVMGKKDGLTLINKLEGIECLLIDDKNELHYSENLKLRLLKKN
jgi:thiamine biosynthesis lipoprotein